MKTKLKQVDWEEAIEYKLAVVAKVFRAMKSYGYSSWMTIELKKIGVSI